MLVFVPPTSTLRGRTRRKKRYNSSKNTQITLQCELRCKWVTNYCRTGLWNNFVYVYASEIIMSTSVNLCSDYLKTLLSGRLCGNAFLAVFFCFCFYQFLELCGAFLPGPHHVTKGKNRRKEEEGFKKKTDNSARMTRRQIR
ncbi:hypothetical protein, unlikely [Trypanosoma brucei gambiense DAL972]|uniref:Uncharacterized protein n=1 Tax=Trypanosoma brucei gambiense (strain MHOM/CI/86/DAL972) TaxID=679716 RepID=C9ZRZ1_TRYB9|nr:hypothetical protein, unlikely [Trypanosoma brucei gambiense DAL972]CBH12127.1 hypothetical protein, unlikely [Trypanosoma brucei gambiense DAL972]|eukprot:XP_011774410.1 hypothetical protein, unlikely [Trypanosoma brucei gambiense DAL972]